LPEKVRDLSFREELHAIDAVVGGQGVAICSDVVVSNELRSGLLVKTHPLSLPGYGFYLVSMACALHRSLLDVDEDELVRESRRIYFGTISAVALCNAESRT
jgi:DNA-binding transcriptional LysR family regulator